MLTLVTGRDATCLLTCAQISTRVEEVYEPCPQPSASTVVWCRPFSRSTTREPLSWSRAWHDLQIRADWSLVRSGAHSGVHHFLQVIASMVYLAAPPSSSIFRPGRTKETAR